ncbi:MAG: S-methyl-5-thioribose-1-phosphate isomerase [candidate division KSB1 bacterium]|nr:S-methyl-5-thioribose-1-phosphate isomerase [candidate division KSB1 bacterium]MDZ7340641.1 S-methyl-5-thioribose-1-phosphate isomerase [candidate division KSB1 bacterium]
MIIRTISWQDGKLVIIDQTRLPVEEIYVKISDYRDLAQAIQQLKIRGAPAIGIAAAFGVCLGANAIETDDYHQFKQHVNQVIAVLAATRPTAVNLFWALNRMQRIIDNGSDRSPSELRLMLLNEAQQILAEDQQVCRRIGAHGATLLKPKTTVLTHCNAGALATGDYGTALGVIYAATEQGKKIRVFADETRPLLQGARLTAWELMKAGIEVTLICDNMAAWVMQQGWIDCVLVGADRIAANGDTANKIGTYNLAVLAKHHGVPFYVVAPTSTIDPSLESGRGIPIEQRAPAEVTDGFGRKTAPMGVTVYNPAFDVTPHQLITAVICEQGIVYPPFKFNKVMGEYRGTETTLRQRPD